MAHAHLWWSFWGLATQSRAPYIEFSLSVDRPRRFGDHQSSHYSRELYGELHDQKLDLRRHYYDISHLFFSIFAAVMSWAIFLNRYWAYDLYL